MLLPIPDEVNSFAELLLKETFHPILSNIVILQFCSLSSHYQFLLHVTKNDSNLLSQRFVPSILDYNLIGSLTFHYHRSPVIVPYIYQT